MGFPQDNTKKSPNSNLLNLIILQGHKLSILLIEMTKSMVLYEGGKKSPSDAC